MKTFEIDDYTHIGTEFVPLSQQYKYDRDYIKTIDTNKTLSWLELKATDNNADSLAYAIRNMDLKLIHFNFKPLFNWTLLSRIVLVILIIILLFILVMR
jgi:hypothetical protein